MTLGPPMPQSIEGPILGVARRYSLCDNDAWDAIARGLAIALRHRARIRPETAAAWFATVVRHEAMRDPAQPLPRSPPGPDRPRAARPATRSRAGARPAAARATHSDAPAQTGPAASADHVLRDGRAAFAEAPVDLRVGPAGRAHDAPVAAAVALAGEIWQEGPSSGLPMRRMRRMAPYVQEIRGQRAALGPRSELEPSFV
jgi:hypothetical protein